MRLNALKIKKRASRRGFSILELLIAVIIIGILAAILIPIIANRTQKARVSAAKSDLERIGTALEQVAVDTGYYTRLFLIDDTGGPVSGTPIYSNGGDVIYNNIRTYSTLTTYYNGVEQRLFINIAGDNLGDFVQPTAVNNALLDQLQENETLFNWNGPYISFQQDDNNPDSPGSADGLPDDPWGNNYLFFTREGLLVEPDGIIETASFTINGVTANTDVFDRMTLLSLGQDGIPGSQGNTSFGQGDDLIRSIGP